jgi:hypothetical protein
MPDVPVPIPTAPDAPTASPVDSPVADDDSTPAADRPARTLEEVEADLAKTRREAQGLRTRLREAEPLAKKALEADEASKSETQKALDRALAAEKAHSELQEGYARMELAVTYHIEPEDIDLIGSGTREEMDGRAQRIAAKNAAASKAGPPPTDRPIEGLRPGASPEPPKPADNSYPEQWKPPYLREKESRSFNGQ